jgi:hypothetical protein
MFFVLGKTTWTHILTHQGQWNPADAIAWCVWTAFATLAALGIIRPLKMLPILLLEIFYKVLWLIIDRRARVCRNVVPKGAAPVPRRISAMQSTIDRFSQWS